MQRSLAAGRGERRLSEQDSTQVLSWLHEALTELERRPQAGVPRGADPGRPPYRRTGDGRP